MKLVCIILILAELLSRVKSGPNFVRRPPVPIIDAECSRTLSREAVSIITADILPLAKQFSISPSFSTCELLPERARFYPQEAQKRAPGNTNSLGNLFGGAWACGWCGKEFRNEWFLDWHFVRRHSVNDSTLGGPPNFIKSMNDQEETEKDIINSGATCLAHYCGMLGCPSVVFAPPPEDSSIEDSTVNGPEFRRPKGYVPPTVSSTRSPISAAAASSDPLIEPAREAEANTAAVPRGLPHQHANGAFHDPHAASRKDAILTKTQQLERARCKEVINSCFPLPDPSDEDLPKSAMKEEDTTTFSNEGSGLNLNQNQNQSKTLRRSIRASTLLERTNEVRKQLEEIFCEADTHVKRTREMDRSRIAAKTSTRWTIGIVMVLVGCIAGGVWFAIGFFHNGSKQRLATERRNREGFNNSTQSGVGEESRASGVANVGGESRYRRMMQ